MHCRLGLLALMAYDVLIIRLLGWLIGLAGALRRLVRHE